jgi:predicted nucleotidyltransferase component of viral defense system
MLEMLSFVAEEKCFALKGGTAINFFLRDMPRLSVDIDLTYLPIEDRAPSLNNISAALNRIAVNIKKGSAGLKIQSNKVDGYVSKLHVSSNEAQIKIEPNLIIRGSLFPTQELSLSPAVEELFGRSVSMNVVAMADLYGGKICAALDRQHPRDLFDIKVLFESEGLTEQIRRGFVVALASHNRPMSELLSPVRKDIAALYQNQFAGMTSSAISLDELLATREKLIAALIAGLSAEEKMFLVSIKEGQPKWELLNLNGIESLPAIKWKIANIKKLKLQQRLALVNRLKKALDL